MSEIAKCNPSEWRKLRAICIDTFVDTYGDVNTPENLQSYLIKNFSAEKIQKDLANPNKEFWLVKVQGKIVGYLQLNYNDAQTEDRGPTLVEVERIYIDPSQKGKGLGQQIMRHAVNTAKQKSKKILWLGVWDQNVKAIQFYERYGFQKRGTHDFVLGDEVQNDWIMEIDL